ncbi:uncharacterized protein I303_106710 [Kwoniella dejecticola CBS 10117]|uniref:Uncharacterized protein n=1 Tax=Kwoniella dejecticola CBS 10117 TaxID=1296121 RepID=A0A1A5ZTW4_9TREE|nr:uncharacterized protein I303_08648 [Kwoniella dejecticola CBS 10117]OBR81262.1 hypothetical protein I303_08648 [Kwoniella dejecticola CBS 10117]
MSIPEILQAGAMIALQYAKEHPYQTAALAGCGVIAGFPALVSRPALTVMGFTRGGERKKSRAAKAHRKNGPVVKRSEHADLQSAGAAPQKPAAKRINARIQAVAAAAGAVGIAGSVWTYLKE